MVFLYWFKTGYITYVLITTRSTTWEERGRIASLFANACKMVISLRSPCACPYNLSLSWKMGKIGCQSNSIFRLDNSKHKGCRWTRTYVHCEYQSTPQRRGRNHEWAKAVDQSLGQNSWYASRSYRWRVTWVPSYQAVRCYQGSRLPNLLDRSPCCHLPYDRRW